MGRLIITWPLCVYHVTILRHGVAYHNMTFICVSCDDGRVTHILVDVTCLIHCNNLPGKYMYLCSTHGTTHHDTGAGHMTEDNRVGVLMFKYSAILLLISKQYTYFIVLTFCGQPKLRLYNYITILCDC